MCVRSRIGSHHPPRGAQVVLPERAGAERLCLTSDGFVRRTDATGCDQVFAFDAFPGTFEHAPAVAHAAVVLACYLARDVAAPARPAAPAAAAAPKRVVDEAEVPGWGRFTSYTDGMIRAAFVDNTMLKLWWAGERRRCAAVLASGDNLEVVPMASATECAMHELQ